jgi:polysaccharide biosynthesis protein PslG
VPLAVRTRPARQRARMLVVLMSILALLACGASLLAQRQSRESLAKVRPSLLRNVPFTDVNPYGANFFLQWEAEPWKVERTLQMAKEAGVGWVKQQFPWEELEPKKGRYWDERQNRSTWDKYDRIVDLARQNGLQVIARLDRPPAWSRKDNTLREAPPDNFDDYGNYVHAVVSHYQGKIRYYELWNEPNIRPEWGSQTPDPEAYVQLLKIGYQKAKAADPSVFVLSAPLAQTLERSPNAMNDLDYLEEMYRAGAAAYFDILFANAYGFGFTPDDPADPGRLNFRRVELSRKIMERYGDAHKPVWFNEFGWNASPDTFTPDKLPWGRVTEAQQTEYTIAAIQHARDHWSWSGVFAIWYFRQAGQITADRSDYYFRMVDPGFTPRLLYHAVKSSAAGIFVARPGQYQSSNPAVTTEGSWRLLKDSAAKDGTVTVSEQAGDALYITFDGDEIDLAVLEGPNCGVVSITVDGIESNLLPSDRQGKSHLDLYAETVAERQVPVAAGLPTGKHKIRLSVSANRNPVAKGNRIAVEGFTVRQAGMGSAWATVAWVSGAIALSMLVLYLWLRLKPGNGNGRS